MKTASRARAQLQKTRQSLSKARRRGHSDFHKCMALDENPFYQPSEKNSQLAEEWRIGWISAKNISAMKSSFN